jgi:hypothetical protein
MVQPIERNKTVHSCQYLSEEIYRAEFVMAVRSVSYSSETSIPFSNYNVGKNTIIISTNPAGLSQHLHTTLHTIKKITSGSITRRINTIHIKSCVHIQSWVSAVHLPLSWPSPPFSIAQQSLVGHGLLIIEASLTLSDTSHSVGLLWTSDQSDADTSTWQHTWLYCDYFIWAYLVLWLF